MSLLPAVGDGGIVWAAMKAGLVSFSGIGPWVYIERGDFVLHAWARWFRLPWHRGFKWRIYLRIPHGHMVSRVSVGNG